MSYKCSSSVHQIMRWLLKITNNWACDWSNGKFDQMVMPPKTLCQNQPNQRPKANSTISCQWGLIHVQQVVCAQPLTLVGPSHSQGSHQYKFVNNLLCRELCGRVPPMWVVVHEAFPLVNRCMFIFLSF
jgi:hypothetical protein